MTTSTDTTRTEGSIFGNMKVEFGTYTLISGDTVLTLTPSLRDVHMLVCSGELKRSVSGTTYTITVTDPSTGGATGQWMAIGY